MSTAEHSPYILWLPSWYPCKLTPYDGDFIQRHARAVSQYNPVHVIHFVRDKDGKITKDVEVVSNDEGNLTETIIYYYSQSFAIPTLDSFFSFKKFNHLYKKFLADYFKKDGLPSLVHVHIAFKAGLIARWIKKNAGIEYLLTEQWTAYLEEAKPNLRDLSFSSQYLISKIITEASLILPVSHYLAKAIKRRWPTVKCEIVPNVVNKEIFYPQSKTETSALRLIHISTLTYQKDPETLFEAMGILIKKGVDFTLDVIGPANEYIVSLIKKEGIGERVNLRGEMPQLELAGFLSKNDALILYSRYETFGCVIIEANACGLPVIVPDTQLMHELVQTGVNGLLVHPGSASALAEALINFATAKNRFSKNEIAKEAADKYSYSCIGKMYADIYFRYMVG